MLWKKSPQLTELQRLEQQRQREQLIRSRRQLFFLTLVVWAIMFLVLRDAFKLGGNPMVTFIVMIALLFVVFFTIRVTTVKAKFWWRNFKRQLAAFFKRFK